MLLSNNTLVLEELGSLTVIQKVKEMAVRSQLVDCKNLKADEE